LIPDRFNDFPLLPPSYLFADLLVARREVREIGKIASKYFGGSENTKRLNASAV
jgi:hypothetical protein